MVIRGLHKVRRADALSHSFPKSTFLLPHLSWQDPAQSNPVNWPQPGSFSELSSGPHGKSVPQRNNVVSHS